MGLKKTEGINTEDVEARAGTTGLVNYTRFAAESTESLTKQLQIEITCIMQISQQLQMLEATCHSMNERDLFEEANSIYDRFFAKLVDREQLMVQGAQSLSQDDDVWNQYEYNINDFERIHN